MKPSDLRPFVFLDDKDNPYFVVWWGTSPWLFYWHKAKKWVSLRPVEWADLPAMQARMLSDEQAKLYHDLNARNK